MIKFSLNCAKDHTFEIWFKSSADYDKQKKRGLVACPSCGNTKVAKALMAPNIGVRQNKKSQAQRAVADVSPPAPVQMPTQTMSSELSEKQRAMLALMREVRREVEKNAEYVGPRFAQEARKIHDDEAPMRGIYGEATVEEAKALIEDGIEAFPLPMLPEDKN